MLNTFQLNYKKVEIFCEKIWIRKLVMGQKCTTVRAESPERPLRILKCFCGCSELTPDLIMTYLQMNVKGVVENQASRTLFINYLKIEKDESFSLKLLKYYDCCALILNDLNSYPKYRDGLKGCAREKQINTAFESKLPKEQLEAVLEECQTYLVCEIESRDEYENFRETLRNKIK